MATSKQSPKSMWRILPVSLSSIRLEGCLEGEGGGGGGRGRVREGEGVLYHYCITECVDYSKYFELRIMVYITHVHQHTDM